MAFSCAGSSLHGCIGVAKCRAFYPRARRWASVRASSELQPRLSADASVSADVAAPSTRGADAVLKGEAAAIGEVSVLPELDHGGGGGGGHSPDGSGGNGKFPPAGGDGGGGGGGDGGNGGEEEDEFGPILSFEEVIKEAEKRGASLPSDMIEAAKSVGIQKILLLRYLDLQASNWPIGDAIKSCSILRNRMLVDPAFLFKIGSEIFIDSCCATFAEVQKRGEEFWSEFELYLADMLVGVVVNVALVGMLAPYARFGRASASDGLLGRVRHAYDALPSSVFEAERPGCRFSIQQRIGTYFFKGILYGTVGFFCGLVGQGIANVIMTTKRYFIFE